MIIIKDNKDYWHFCSDLIMFAKRDNVLYIKYEDTHDFMMLKAH